MCLKLSGSFTGATHFASASHLVCEARSLAAPKKVPCHKPSCSSGGSARCRRALSPSKGRRSSRRFPRGHHARNRRRCARYRLPGMALVSAEGACRLAWQLVCVSPLASVGVAVGVAAGVVARAIAVGAGLSPRRARRSPPTTASNTTPPAALQAHSSTFCQTGMASFSTGTASSIALVAAFFSASANSPAL
jgi:hypothetical protein